MYLRDDSGFGCVLRPAVVTPTRSRSILQQSYYLVIAFFLPGIPFYPELPIVLMCKTQHQHSGITYLTTTPDSRHGRQPTAKVFLRIYVSYHTYNPDRQPDKYNLIILLFFVLSELAPLVKQNQVVGLVLLAVRERATALVLVAKL